MIFTQLPPRLAPIPPTNPTHTHTHTHTANPLLAVPRATPIKQLMQDIMIMAHSKGYDVFNALNLLEVSAGAKLPLLCDNFWHHA